MKPIVGMAERGGRVEATAVTRVNKKTLQAVLKERIDSDGNMMIDEWKGYNRLDRWFKSHNRITHGVGEYVRGDIHTNTIESFWSILKRGIYDIYHHVSRKHLDKYIDEFEFRCNSKHVADTERFGLMLDTCSGRLMYKSLIEKKSV